jgi:membrane dipeptidase
MGTLPHPGPSVGARVAALFADSVVWDNHACMPLRPEDERFLPQLRRYREAGVDAVTLNVGFDSVPWDNTGRMLTAFRTWVQARSEDYVLVERVEDIALAAAQGRLAVMFDIEGGSALNGELQRVGEYYRLGVRWMLIAYNRNNALGGGCQDEDTGLTEFGRQVIAEMERVGMVVCCSHTGFRTTMEVMERARNPVIFSHSNPLGMWRHRRNIPDEAIKACAATGGVVGINGVGAFLGRNDTSSATLARHIDYVVNLVGPKHVGFGLDYVFDMQELIDFLKQSPQRFPPEEYGDGPPAFVAPEQLPEIVGELARLGYDDAALRDILGGNLLRIARQVWRS